mmetsp:Transcript_27014/g.44887  ORF Transcript_27014/g.44887 Transcript_27014/m.44887 type:complete len:280 (-) Transcript_27014:36-875(-)
MSWQNAPHQSLPIPHNLTHCSDIPIPVWMLEAIRSTTNAADPSTSACVHDSSLPTRGHLPPHPPSYDSSARQVVRVEQLAITSEDFYRQFARSGMPLVLSNIFAADPPWWESHASKLMACLDDELERHRSSQSVAEAAADRRCQDLHPSCTFGPWYVDACHGESFGGPDHYDHTCYGTLSIQYSGHKTWTLWAPWEVQSHDGQTVPAHARFVATLKPGDALLKAPGWLHATLIDEGVSLSAAHFIDVPYYDLSLSNQSLWPSPFGFDACAAGKRTHGTD